MTHPRALRVLLVEDDEEDFMITRDLFDEIEHHDYEIDWVDNYDEALVEIRRQRHDVYLLDYHLGAHDGLELLQAAIECGCRAPMIMLTGQGGRQVDLDAMKLGAYDYLVKGQITPSMLERAVRYALEHAKSTEALRQTVRLSNSLLTAVNHIPAGVVITDPSLEDDPIIFANHAYVKMVGYRREDILGRNPRFLQGEGTDPEQIKGIRIALDADKPWRGQLLNYRENGEQFINQMSIFPVRDRHGEVVHHVVICLEKMP